MNAFSRTRATAWLAVCAAVAAGALFPADCFAERMSKQKQDALFIAAKSDMGGAILEPLIRKCNSLRDSDVPLCSKDRKGLIMKRLSESIGPISRMTNTKKATLPPGFKQAFEKYKTLIRLGHAKAYAEAGACIFAETMKGEFGMDDRRAFEYFQKAAEKPLGISRVCHDPDAMRRAYGTGRAAAMRHLGEVRDFMSRP